MYMHNLDDQVWRMLNMWVSWVNKINSVISVYMPMQCVIKQNIMQTGAKVYYFTIVQR